MDTVTLTTLINVNWLEYLHQCEELLDHHVASGVDGCHSKLSDLAKFCASLDEFKLKQRLNPVSTIRTSESWMKHIFLGFLIYTSSNTLREIAESTDLEVLSSSTTSKGMRLALVSGSLNKWKDAIILFSIEDSNSRIRDIFNKVKSAIDKLGLSAMWFSYTAKTLPDDTFYLEHNK